MGYNDVVLHPNSSVNPCLQSLTILRKFCGPIAEAWGRDADGQRMPFQIVRLQSGPVVDSVTFSTVGLGKIPLERDKIIRHELLVLARSAAVPRYLGRCSDK